MLVVDAMILGWRLLGCGFALLYFVCCLDFIDGFGGLLLLDVFVGFVFIVWLEFAFCCYYLLFGRL